MRFVLTVVDPNRGVSADVVVDAEPGLTVAGFLPSLVEAVGRPVAVPGSARVINLHGPGASADQLPTIFVDGQPVDPRLSLAESPLREGTLVTLADLDTETPGPGGSLPPIPFGLADVPSEQAGRSPLTT